MAGHFDLKAYKNDGFTIVRNVFPQDVLQEISIAFDELKIQARSFSSDTFVGPTYFNLHRDCDPFDQNILTFTPITGELRRVTYPYLVSPALDTYRTWEPLLRIVEQILGNDIVQLVNQANFNPPKRGTGWGWHQDYRFRRKGLTNIPFSFVQCLLAVDFCSKANGGIRLVPQSDKLGPLTLDTCPEKFTRCAGDLEIVQPDMQPGDVVFFNPYVIHGSTPNLSQLDRRVYINGYASASAVPHGIPVMRHGVIIPTANGIMEFEEDPNFLPTAAKY